MPSHQRSSNCHRLSWSLKAPRSDSSLDWKGLCRCLLLVFPVPDDGDPSAILFTASSELASGACDALGLASFLYWGDGRHYRRAAAAAS